MHLNPHYSTLLHTVWSTWQQRTNQICTNQPFHRFTDSPTKLPTVWVARSVPQTNRHAKQTTNLTAACICRMTANSLWITDSHKHGTERNQLNKGSGGGGWCMYWFCLVCSLVGLLVGLLFTFMLAWCCCWGRNDAQTLSEQLMTNVGFVISAHTQTDRQTDICLHYLYFL